MATIFSKIVQGDIPCYKIFDNQKFLAFLDINPLKVGHTLIIPKKEVDYIFDISDDDLGEMMIFAKIVAKRLKSKIECKRIAVVVLGLEIAHAHIHLIPMNSEVDIDFSNEKLQLTKEEFLEIQKILVIE